jgi:hypothetical protein
MTRILSILQLRVQTFLRCGIRYGVRSMCLDIGPWCTEAFPPCRFTQMRDGDRFRWSALQYSMSMNLRLGKGTACEIALFPYSNSTSLGGTVWCEVATRESWSVRLEFFIHSQASQNAWYPISTARISAQSDSPIVPSGRTPSLGAT